MMLMRVGLDHVIVRIPAVCRRQLGSARYVFVSCFFLELLHMVVTTGFSWIAFVVTEISA